METHCVLFQTSSEFLYVIYMNGAAESVYGQEIFIIYYELILICLTQMILCFVVCQNANFVNICATNTNWGVRLNIYSFLNSAVNGGE